jgi:two-component system OmpR family response regulator
MPIQKVLLVDDDQNLRRIGQLSLRNVGRWQVLLATCGAEALSIARVEKPDVILLDVMMPAMDGPSTLSQLRSLEETMGIPVIFLTAKIQIHEVDDYIRLGAVGVIIKPFDPMTLPFDIERMLVEPEGD